MAVSKFRIYDYWKDKAITKKFEIKPVSACCFANKLRKIFIQSAKKKRRLKGF